VIYLDNAATSLQKPRSVPEAVSNAIRAMASPGRGGHRPAMLAAETAYNCREEIAELFGMSKPENVIFTLNATHALNIAVKSAVRPGDRVVISGYEHNAVARPLYASGAEVITAASPLFDQSAAIDAFAAALPGADVCVCNHVSNVFGFILPIREISKLCRKNGVSLILDLSQSAGTLDIDFTELDALYAAMPGHKGLFGPQGTGVLLCRESAAPLMQGGTGSNSASREMPDFLPDRLEAGTHNIAGIAGLLAGVRYIKATGAGKILRHERELLRLLAASLKRIDGLELFLADEPSVQTGVLSVRHPAAACETVAEELGRLGIAVRAGLHCSPVAHETAGTLDTGTVRFSLSPFNCAGETRKAAEALSRAIRAA